MKFFYLIATLSFYIVNCEREELFSAVEELLALVQNEDILIKEVKNLNAQLQHTMEIVNLKLNDIEKDHDVFKRDYEKFIQNPLNSLILIKRLSHDIDTIQSLFKNVLDNFSKSIERAKIPKKEFEGAVEGLFRIQEIYQISSENLAMGIIDGKKYRDALSADDLFLIGKEMIKFNEKSGLEYLKLAKEKNVEIPGLVFLEQLFDIFMEYKLLDKAAEIIDEILRTDRSYKDYEMKRMKIEMESLRDANEKAQKKQVAAHQRLVDLTSSYYTEEKDKMILSKACRGKLLRSNEELSKLYCKFESRTPFTIISPFKIEIANLDPYIAIFHDILSESEINAFMLMLTDLKRAEILSPNSTNKVSRKRVAKLKFFNDDQHKLFPKLMRRVGDMTGLNMETSEVWQIQNYGIGGHYTAHHDYAEEGQEFKGLTTGNRIATTLFYLTDVEKGGATVFPLLKVYVPAKKASAVFWYNLSSSGHREVLTRHSGCPVLIGSKTVVNKWLHEYGQEFARPCELKPKLTDPKYYLQYFKLEDYGIKVTVK